MDLESWRKSFDSEAERGQKAQAAGNQGMARVCARRAAGHLVRAYLVQAGEALAGPSALHALRQLAESNQTPQATRELAEGFLLRITPEHVLPVDIDLLDELKKLDQALFP